MEIVYSEENVAFSCPAVRVGSLFKCLFKACRVFAITLAALLVPCFLFFTGLQGLALAWAMTLLRVLSDI
jgi:hypothetical protein